jgi:hypothetical protein
MFFADNEFGASISSMGDFYRILTAAFLVIHLMVGCCAHHAHACEGQPRTSPPAGDNTLPHGLCPDAHHDHSHHGTHDCQGAKCSFVPSPNKTIARLLIQVFEIPTVSLVEDVLASYRRFSGQHICLTGRLLLPVRLHLANQVLLI